MTTLPEALRLAEYLRFPAHCPNEYVRDRQAADELIRLYEENEKLREAAQQALEAMKEGTEVMEVHLDYYFEAMNDLRAALAQEQEQAEPVAWIDIDRDGQRLTVRQWSDGNRDEVPLYTAPPKRQPLAEPVQEPVAWAAVTENGKLYKAASTRESAERKAEQQEAKFGDTWRPLHVVPLYTAPPQRKPLTEEEIYAAIKGIDSLKAVEVARAIERAHGITGPEDKGG